MYMLLRPQYVAQIRKNRRFPAVWMVERVVANAMAFPENTIVYERVLGDVFSKAEKCCLGMVGVKDPTPIP